MRKLLDAYRTNPTLKNAQKLKAYERAHHMAVCLLTREDAEVVYAAIAHANRGGTHDC